MKYNVEIASCSMIYIHNLFKIHAGIQAIFMFSLRDLRDSNVGITDERNLSVTPLKWG
jgi:hypothetical protein